MTLNSSGGIVGYDDYYPFGAQMPGRSSVSIAEFRYRFTGKERDVNETGWDYFGARYYDSRIGRWLGVDPLERNRPGLNPYNYVQNNPLLRIDPDGRQDEENNKKSNNFLTSMFETVKSFLMDKSGISNSTSKEKANVGDESTIKALNDVSKDAKEATQTTTEGLQVVHDAANTVSGVSAGLSLSTTGTPASPFFLGVSNIAGGVGTAAGGLKYSITGNASDRNQFVFDLVGMASGQITNVVKQGKNLTKENVQILKPVLDANYNALQWGVSLGF